MMIELTPNYGLMLNIILVLWFILGSITLVLGLLGGEKKSTTSKNGTIEILSGLLSLCIVAAVLIF